jgi:hypothetical protein
MDLLPRQLVGSDDGAMQWFRHYHPTKNDDAYNRYQEQTYRTYGILEAQLKKTGGQSVLEGLLLLICTSILGCCNMTTPGVRWILIRT